MSSLGHFTQYCCRLLSIRDEQQIGHAFVNRGLSCVSIRSTLTDNARYPTRRLLPRVVALNLSFRAVDSAEVASAVVFDSKASARLQEEWCVGCAGSTRSREECIRNNVGVDVGHLVPERTRHGVMSALYGIVPQVFPFQFRC